MNRAVSVAELEKRRFKEMAFEGAWLESFGKPERSGVWLIWGASGNGKTSFAMQLAKYITAFGTVAYNTMEEGARKSMQRAVVNTGMREVARRFILLDREPVEELKERLRKRKSKDIIIIDSYQYTGLTKKEYIALKEEFPKKLFIFISHAEGKQPEGRSAKIVRYDADVKIFIEGYKAFPTSRYGGGAEYTIWAEGADSYWGDID
ncbi:MAG: hypothetical protein JXR60_06070 [Bacteroidales bacterium]|nr:hypothetical protein [Bacteroidales bacterium]